MSKAKLLNAVAIVAVWPVVVQAAANPESAPPSDKAVTVDEVIVTAQKHQDKLRDVPLSVTVLGAAQLVRSGISNTADLTDLTPGLKMDHVGTYTQPAIRGISSSLSQPGSEGTVAVYLDGVYQPSLAGGTFDFPDISRIEVLKGPQGTLFGRNAAGGAIQIFTLDPTPNFSAYGKVAYGNYNDRTVTGFVSGPIAPGVEFSLMGYNRENDGYNHDLRNGGQLTGALRSSIVRGKLLFTPMENFHILVTGFYSRRSDPSGGFGLPLNGNTDDRLVPGAIIPTHPWDVATNIKQAGEIESYGGSIKGTLDTQYGTVTSITAYTKYNEIIIADVDYAYAPGSGTDDILSTPERAFSQELDFASVKMGPVRLVTGVFYYDSNGSYYPARVVGPGFDVSIYSQQSAQAASVFGEAYVDLTSRLSLIAGLRYSHEDRQYGGLIIPTVAPIPTLPQLGKRTDNDVTPRVSVRYNLTPLSNVYFTYSQGFKSGSFNLTEFSPNSGVSPEKVTSYEVGSKNSFGPLDLNAAAFYYNYDDLQVQSFVTVGGVAFPKLQNAASARIYGLDADASLRLSRSLSLRAGLSLLDAKYVRFPSASVTTPLPGNVGSVNTTINASGKYLVRSPPVTLTLTGNYTTEVLGGHLDLSSTVYYSDRFYFDAADRVSQAPFVTVAARAAWSPNDGHVTFAVYGRNLTNEAVLQGAFLTTNADGVSFAPPRTYGVSVEYRF
ncbi:MAG: TonB-dependent receptor [Caulobacteraceae bacterium]|jgi:iron complex outermembrane receptor protein|nr:TonB-dependent receptor [Caulobacteraceae bacterium]